jgi:hypothetical protein
LFPAGFAVGSLTVKPSLEEEDDDWFCYSIVNTAILITAFAAFISCRVCRLITDRQTQLGGGR